MSDQCDNHMTTGGRCDRGAGHPGPHEKSYPNGATYRWTDESAARFADEHGSGFD